MDIEGTYAFEDVSVEQVWNKLLDPEVLARAIPGCQRLEATGEDTYEATMTVGISAVKGTYSGRIVIDDKQPPHHYRIAVEGSGTRGFIRGEGTLDLAQDDSRTIVTYKGTAQLGGAIAGVGMRMVGGAAKMLINQFFGAIKNELATNI
jgi:carbon monoxide dehydrogenase subunit G